MATCGSGSVLIWGIVLKRDSGAHRLKGKQDKREIQLIPSARWMVFPPEYPVKEEKSNRITILAIIVIK